MKKWGMFSEIFGVNPRNRILEFFLEMQDLDFSMGDVAKETGLIRMTTYNVMNELTKEGYLIPTRKVSGGQLYKLNIEKKEVKLLIRAFNTILDKIVEKYEDKEKKKLYA